MPSVPRRRCSVKCAPTTLEWCCGTDVAMRCAPCDCFRMPRQFIGKMRVSKFAAAPRRASGAGDGVSEVLAAASWRRRSRTTTIGDCRVSATRRDGALGECRDSRSSATRRDGALDQATSRGGDFSRNARGFGHEGEGDGLKIEGPARTMRWTRRAVMGSSPTAGADTAVDHRRSGGRAGHRRPLAGHTKTALLHCR